MYKRLSILALAFSLALALGGSPVQANLIDNGSFENKDSIVVDPAKGYVTVGGTTIPDWTVFQGFVDYVEGLWTPQDGSHSLDVDGTVAGGIKQSFATIIGEVYQVSFWLAGNPSNQSADFLTKTLNVKVGIFDQDFIFNVQGKSSTNMGWIEQTFQFTAQGSTSTLQFLSKTAGALGPALDNVSVNQVPLPASWLLLASGLLGLPFLGRRKKY